MENTYDLGLVSTDISVALELYTWKSQEQVHLFIDQNLFPSTAKQNLCEVSISISPS